MAKNWTDNWEQVRELGRGGQGTTYEVRSRGSAESAVLKLLNQTDNTQARKRMAVEAINLQALNGVGAKVPRLFEHNTAEDFGDSSVALYIVMEFVPGKTLNHVVAEQGGRLSFDKCVAVLNAMCDAVDLMHKNDVLHRDLKPANLMVRDYDSNDIVVLDFGLSYDRARKQETITRPGETIKNEMVALPEAVTPAGDRRDQRSDITNVVVLFFYCLTGQMPVSLRNEKELPPHRWPGQRRGSPGRIA
jgi:serine/threonine protein kinase